MRRPMRCWNRSSAPRIRGFRCTRGRARTSSASCWPRICSSCKGLNDLLREFRSNRNPLAIVIDEFGRVAGLITIEDVLEQIVGEIEDEFDIPEDEGDIFSLAD